MDSGRLPRLATGLLAGAWLTVILCLSLLAGQVGQPKLNLRYSPALIVSTVNTDGGHHAGRPFDIILALDDHPVATTADIAGVLGRQPGRDRHTLTVRRDGRQLALSVRSQPMSLRGMVGANLALWVFGLAYLLAASALVWRRAEGPAVPAFFQMALWCGLFPFLGTELETSHRLLPLNFLVFGLAPLSMAGFGYALMRPRHPSRLPLVLGAGFAAFLWLTCLPVGLLGAEPARFLLQHTVRSVVYPALILGAIGCLLAGMVSGIWQSPRYAAWRQQLTIILTAAVVSFVPVIWVWLIAVLRGRPPYQPVAALALVATGIMPLATAAALLRYRLADLERLIRRTLTYSLTAGFLSAGYIGAYTVLATRMPGTHPITGDWQFVLLLTAALAFEPLQRATQRSLDRYLYGDRLDVTLVLRRFQRYSDSKLPSEDLLRLIAVDVADALQLHRIAVALPEAEGWRIASGHQCPGLVGETVPGPIPAQPTFWPTDPAQLLGFTATIRLDLVDQPVSLLLLGPKRNDQPLTEIDLRYMMLFLAPLSGMIGYARTLDLQRQNEAAIASLYDQIGSINLAALDQSTGSIDTDGLTAPLKVIIDQAGALLHGAHGLLDTTHDQRVRLIQQQAMRLSRALTDTDALQSLMQGTARLDPCPTTLPALIAAAWAEVQPNALTKHVRFAVTTDGLPPVLADPIWLHRAFVHLLDNAAAHSPPGSDITCQAGVSGTQVTLTITDTGPGIAVDRLHALRASPFTLDEVQRQGHWGIGLALAQATVRHLGGTVHIDSGLGVGTTVTVTLPVAAAERVRPEP
ncbi:MAG: hypothetical protein H7338_23795 [Candidatus Sericytochromatia bacterium]|nr:hypothetical protein [Candidatus Sericytochromatia bacterium]